MDIVKVAFNNREMSFYREEVLRTALEKSFDKFGPYQLIINRVAASPTRLKKELNSAKLINVSIGLTTIEREKNSIAVKIPISRGLLNHRLILVNKNNINNFAYINSLEHLKALKAGMINQWILNKVLSAHQFNILEIENYQSLFSMLETNKYDYTIRGVYEIYDEINSAKKRELHQLAILPNIAIYLNTPTYVFVSPKKPELARRLEWGLSQMVHDGSFDKLLEKWFGKYIEASHLSQRKVLTIENKFLPKGTPVDQESLWYQIPRYISK